MGIPGLLKEVGRGERIALSKLAIEHFERTSRPLRIAIDAAIWQFQHQAGQGGKNPALRTLFFRLVRLLALPIHPVFVYDGKQKPRTKRGKTVSRYTTHVDDELSKNLVGRFCFPFHTAPGEAEAECAFLQKHGIVDAVMSQDADAIMFGSGLTLRDWSKEGTKGNKAPTHVSVLDSIRIRERTGLTPDGMVLIALLSGGDYHDGLSGFGPGLACQIAKAGFSADLFRTVANEDELGLREWRERLTYELHTNESGYFIKRHKALSIPADFPDRTILSYYLDPTVSRAKDLKDLERRWVQWWNKNIDLPVLRQYTALTFDWMYKGGAKKFIRTMAQPLFQHRLKNQAVVRASFCVDDITEARKHWTNDGIPELRFRTVPADHVGIDLDGEEDNPEFAPLDEEIVVSESEEIAEEASSTQDPDTEASENPSKKRKRPPWDPQVPEKWWIPQTLLEYGLPHVVEDWHQKQRDIMSDPKKFATRKCPTSPSKKSRPCDRNMKEGAIKDFLPVLGSPAVTIADGKSQLTFPSRPSRCGNLDNNHTKVLPASCPSTITNFFSSSRKVDCSKSTVSAGPIKDRVVIDLLSDDAPVNTTPAERKMTSTSQPSITTDAGTPNISSTVTHRKKRQPKQTHGIVMVTDEQTSLNAITTSIDFEAVILREDSLMTRSNKILKDVTRPGVQARRTSRRLVMPRESLPGTWKEITDRSSGDRKISFVNLVDD